MKKFVSVGSIIVFKPLQLLTRFAWVAVVLLVVAGCSKSSSTPPAAVAAPQSSTSAPTMAVNSQTHSTQTVVVDDTIALQPMNQALMRWTIQNHRHPRTFDEFATTTDFQIPSPPPGKHYILNGRGFVVYADNSTQ